MGLPDDINPQSSDSTSVNSRYTLLPSGTAENNDIYQNLVNLAQTILPQSRSNHIGVPNASYSATTMNSQTQSLNAQSTTNYHPNTTSVLIQRPLVGLTSSSPSSSSSYFPSMRTVTPPRTQHNTLHNIDTALAHLTVDSREMPRINHNSISTCGESNSPNTSDSSSSGGNNIPNRPLIHRVCYDCTGFGNFHCIDCTQTFCLCCQIFHVIVPGQEGHLVNHIHTHLSPIGNNIIVPTSIQCKYHAEAYAFVCNTCKEVICQECTFFDHREHEHESISSFYERLPRKLHTANDCALEGRNLIRANIDRALMLSQSLERDYTEAAVKIRRTFRAVVEAVEEREHQLLVDLEQMRNQKLSKLNEQMRQLRVALAGVAYTSDVIAKTNNNINRLTQLQAVQLINKIESNLLKEAFNFRSLIPQEEHITFTPPNYNIIPSFRTQGSIGLAVPNNQSSPRGRTRSWNLSGTMATHYNYYQSSAPELSPISNKPNVGLCIPGNDKLVTLLPPNMDRCQKFCKDGEGDGELSRPWGICADKDSNIIIADRRNNRIQIFNPDGSFKLKFGSKGNGDGQFDLPSGITTDPTNRLIVVDKDNHRIQIFTLQGEFISKFGSYGRDNGQFQYPWDVACNSIGGILVTDSRNHRIQLFDYKGRFLAKFCFDGNNYSKNIKGCTTPRGVCFTPRGDIIVSDFENHRLILVDRNMKQVLATKGAEGDSPHEFCRPSGVCCDDMGFVVVADSKNHRILIYDNNFKYKSCINIPPIINNSKKVEERDRPSDISILPNGRLMVLLETSPDNRDTNNDSRFFCHVY